MTRREAREAVFGLLFETEFRVDEDPKDIYRSSTEHREIPRDSYVYRVYFGVTEKREELDAQIEKHAKGWTVSRMSRVSRTVLRIATYEMMFMDGKVPMRVSINEAIELSKKFDSEKARGFINGILNAIKNELTPPEETAKTAEGAATTVTDPSENSSQEG